jgi:vancomycin resistance protein YoaR
VGTSLHYARAYQPGSRGRRAQRRYSARREPSPAQALLQTGLLIALLGVALTGVGGAALDVAYGARALPTVRFETIPVGGLHRDEVRGVLATHLNAFEAAPYVFHFGTREWRPTAAEVGLRLDMAGMAEDAVAAGRTLRWPLRGFTSVATLVRPPAVALRATLDRAQLFAFLSAVAAEVDREPTNAALSVRNGRIVVGQAAPGRRVDAAATAARVPVPTSPVAGRVEVQVAAAEPALTDAAIQEAQTTTARILASPLTLRLGDRAWTIGPDVLGGMIEFKRVAGGSGAGADRLQAGLAEARVASYVRTLAAEIDRPAVDAQLRWVNNAVSVVRESADGVKLDQPAAVRAIVAQAPTDGRDVALTTSVTRPAVTSDATTVAGIRQLVATGSSKFAGSSPERVNNIQVAASKLDGKVIPPGTMFSFLTALGPITTEAGYQEGLTIQGDATVPGIGGGVCQVSTTVFRAAFFAGLPIIERHQHTYRVGYYEQDGSPVGFDAAVYDPGVDLRFRNDTENALLMHAQVDTRASTLTFSFYSTPAGRDVKLTPQKTNEVKAGPRLPDVVDPTLAKGVRKQVEWSADGADATIRRLVTVGGQTLFSDAFFSRYIPWREKWVVGAG